MPLPFEPYSKYGAPPEVVLEAKKNELRKQGISEELIAAILEGGIGQQEQEDLMGDTRMAYERLSGRSAPQGRHTGATFVAANPLEYMGKMANDYVDRQDLEGYRDERGALAEQRRDRLKQYFAAMTPDQAHAEQKKLEALKAAAVTP